MKSKTKKLTVASMTCALSVVLMLFGSVFEVMDLSCAAICSALMIFLILELGGAYPALVYCATTLLGMLLLPNKLPSKSLSDCACRGIADSTRPNNSSVNRFMLLLVTI